MTHFRLFSAFALLVVAMGGAMVSASAADPVFPPGARIGMAPLVGLVPAKAFTGFESEDQSVKVLIAELPGPAYGEAVNAFKTNPAIKPESLETGAGTAYYTAETAKNASGTFRHYSMILQGGTFSGYVEVQVPENATKIYSDDAVRQMFVSAVIRKDVPTAKYSPEHYVNEIKDKAGAALMKTHRSYLAIIKKLTAEGMVKGMAHITGGGITENLPRILPKGCGALVETASWTVPPLFQHLQKLGNVERDEMYRTFNMGIGLIVVMPAERYKRAKAVLDRAGEKHCIIGRIVKGERRVTYS